MITSKIIHSTIFQMKKYLLKFTVKPTYYWSCLIIFICLYATSCSNINKQEIGAFKKVQTFSGLNKEFGEPFGIAEKNGEIYVSDGENGRILRVLKDGKTQVLTDKLDTPSQIVFDKNGDLIVTDSTSHTIKKILADGKVEIIAGVENKKGFQDGDAKQSLFNAPIGVTVFEDKIYIADTYNDKIRLIEKGKVSTYAGSEQGFADGVNAKFNTPLGLAVWTDGRILVADSENRRIRVVEQNKNTWTLTGNGTADLQNGLLSEAKLVQPTALTVDRFGSIYIADGNAIRVIGRKFIPVVETISNDRQGFSDGKLKRSRFNRPSGLALDEKGNLFVADSENQLVRVFSVQEIGKTVAVEEFDKKQTTAEEFRKISEPRWTYDPPNVAREIAGTLGEIRGKVENENSQVWFHNGLDIVGGYGETARFIRDEKVLRPNAVQNFETTRESLRLPTIGYVHIRIGRDKEQTPLEDERFQFSFDKDKKPKGVRISRGTKFKAGEAIGTLNTFYHVHLIAGRSGREMNALDALILPGVSDSKVPVIEEIKLYKENWQEFETQNSNERINLEGKVRIVVQAFDQIDGNAARRKLGLYKIGFQLFDENEKPLKDFADPKWTIKFDKTPENEAAKLVYAKGSQSGATGETIFRYIATNKVSGRIMREDFLDVGKLDSGNYLLKVLVADFFGNITSEDIKFAKK